ncbi:MAG: PAS domain-containing sensor histidine kinase [Alphaproteobacteria bacterium]
MGLFLQRKALDLMARILRRPRPAPPGGRSRDTRSRSASRPPVPPVLPFPGHGTSHGASHGQWLGRGDASVGLAATTCGVFLAGGPAAALWFGVPVSVVAPAAALLAGAGGFASMAWVRRMRTDYTLLRAFYEDGADLVIHHDREGRALTVSPGCRPLMGHDGTDLIGRTLHGHVHPADWPALEILLADMRRRDLGPADAPRTADLRLRHRDGGYRWVEMRGAPLRRASAGGLGGFVATVRCIEARKRREETLERARDSAEAASLAKTRFLASVSHELRTPLNAIIGFSEVMCVQMFGPLGARRYQEYADYIHESGKHLLDLINDILDMSKIEAGRYDLELETIRMPLVIEKCLKTIAYSARQAGLKLEVEIDPGVPDLQADGRAMRQVLLNLLSNAIKFTGPGGRVSVGLMADAEWMELSVTDSGVGIPQEALGRLGRPFEQVHKGARSPLPEDADGPRAGLPGTGLGLAIVKALVTLHGGALIIDSEEGVGTTVRVLLPLSSLPGDPSHDDDDLFSLIDLTEGARQAA